MILVDTSIWVDHFRSNNDELFRLLLDGEIVIHPWVVGEIALGNLSNRRITIFNLQSQPQAPMVELDELLEFIESSRLFGRGIGLADAYILASSLKVPGQFLWTRDRRLATAALEIGVPLYQP